MKIVKLKKDVDFSVLLDYGFVYNEENNRYEREQKWTLDNVCHQLVVNKYNREVYTIIQKTTNVNEELKGTSALFISSTLILISPYLEVIEDETVNENQINN